MDDVPDVAEIPAVSIHTSRGLHEGDPGVGQHHQNGPNHVQHHRHAHMDPLQESLSHLVPTVIIDVECSTLRYKEQRVGSHHWPENAREICEESGIQREEGKNDDPTQERCEGIRGQADFDKIIGKLVVLSAQGLILADDAKVFDHHTEDRDRQHKASVVEMLLKAYPQEYSAFKVVPRVVLRTVGRLRRRRSDHRPFGFIPNVSRFFDRFCIGSLRRGRWDRVRSACSRRKR